MVTTTRVREYAHQELGKEYGGMSGYYIPRKEVRLDYKGRDILYILGHAVIESSCCGTGNWDYVLVPGYIVNWHRGINQSGLFVSSVEPVDPKTIKELSSLIETREHTNCITFW